MNKLKRRTDTEVRLGSTLKSSIASALGTLESSCNLMENTVTTSNEAIEIIYLALQEPKLELKVEYASTLAKARKELGKLGLADDEIKSLLEG